MTSSDSTSHPTRWYLGMMSGTSYDAIDVALLRTDGISFLEHGPAQAFPIQTELRERIAAAKGRASAPPELSDAITQAHVEAVRGFLAACPG
jgi:anhydro-N-acetylmuramic acid kinase